jgi:anti-sigma factor RsiW
MTIDDTMLMAYVDGELAPGECCEIEEEIKRSPDVAERVALLNVTRVWGKDAYAHQKLPPVPDTLKVKIDEMVRAAASGAMPLDDGAVGHDARTQAGAPPVPIRSAWRIAPVWLPVAFAAGIFSCVVALRVASQVGLFNAVAPVATASGASPWVMAAAGYQQLYSRATLAHVQASNESSAQTVDEIRREDGLAISIPDLSAAGLTFKRVQRLRFHDKPLIQISYLPEHGEPVALCVVADDKPNQAASEQKVSGMKVVSWRQANLAYALIGDAAGLDLGALAERIRSQGGQALSGVAPSSVRGPDRLAAWTGADADSSPGNFAVVRME